MKEAEKIRNELSTDYLVSTGSVIVVGDKVVARGANQANIKNKKIREIHRKGICVRKILNVKTGQKYWLCPGCGDHRNHSETQAIEDAKKNGANIEGADLYLYGHWWCCQPCWDKMIKAGIKNIYLLEGSENKFNDDV